MILSLISESSDLCVFKIVLLTIVALLNCSLRQHCCTRVLQQDQECKYLVCCSHSLMPRIILQVTHLLIALTQKPF